MKILTILFIAILTSGIIFTFYKSFTVKNRTKETTFKVNLGKGVEVLTYTEIQNLTTNDFSEAFKNAKSCPSINIDAGDWNTCGIPEMLMMCKTIEENERQY